MLKPPNRGGLKVNFDGVVDGANVDGANGHDYKGMPGSQRVITKECHHVQRVKGAFLRFGCRELGTLV